MQQQISPLLQARITNQTASAVNQTTQNNNCSKVDIKQEADSVELNKKNKKKTIKIALIAAGIVATVVGGFALSKKGVFGQKAKNQADKLWNNITSVFKKTPETPETPVTPALPGPTLSTPLEKEIVKKQ